MNAGLNLGPQRLDWARDGAQWPHRERSRFVEAAGLRWHVQVFEPVRAEAATRRACILLLHGTGASTHSWRAIAPLLAERGTVVAPDLPGHAFSSMPWSSQVSLPGMAHGVGALMQALQLTPTHVVGHSAGAAVALQMALDGHLDRSHLRSIVCLNGAVLPLHGPVWQLFSPAAKLLAAMPGVPDFVAWRARNPKLLRQLLESTGSKLDAEGERLYARIVANPGHVAGALQMMARWDLEALRRELPRLAQPPGWPVHFIVGEADTTVPPSVSQRAAALLPGATVDRLPGLGHLAHEEDAPQVLQRLASSWEGSVAAGPDAGTSS